MSQVDMHFVAKTPPLFVQIGVSAHLPLENSTRKSNGKKSLPFDLKIFFGYNPPREVSLMRRKIMINMFITMSALAVVGFAVLFAYNVHGYVSERRQIRAAEEYAAQLQAIFEQWLAQAPPELPYSELPYAEPPPQPIDLPTVDPDYELGMDLDPDDVPEILPDPVDFFALLEEMRYTTRNRDIIGFINIPGTDIQYVVVQGQDNEFYLEHSVFRGRNLAGTVFLDYRNRRDFSDPSSILYGHMLQWDGGKFSQLHRFANRDFFNENRYIQIFTDDELIEYEIFAAFSANISWYYIQVDFAPGEFMPLVNGMFRRNRHPTDVRVGASDRILVLSTCIDDENYRWVVAGRRVPNS
jgi:sortase B